MKVDSIVRNIVCPLLIVVAWFSVSQYTFNTKPDLNGDNIYYYITASSLASGQGYSDLSVLGTPATATYPPGYPILMTPLRMVTDSVVAQKWMNEVFILLSLLLLYAALLRIGLSLPIAFVSTFAGAFIPRLLHFSTMMMSESAFCLTAILALYFLLRASEDEEKWYSELRHPWLYLAILSLILNYHVRTQGLALLAGILFGLLIRKRWAASGATLVGFVLGYLPWSLRNKALGLSNTRYLDMVMVANPWRPEEGSITIGEFFVRFFETLKMLVCSALPGAIMPFSDTNPDQPEYTLGLYLLGIAMVAIIVIGCWQLGKIRWTVIGYFIGTFGIISMFSTPSGNRYLTAILPLLTMGLLLGVYSLVMWGIKRASKTEPKWATYVVALAMLPLLTLAKPGLQEEHKLSNQRYPLPYTQFFKIGKELKKNTPDNTVICSRKPQMLYLYSERPGCNYLYTQDDKELIRDMIRKKVDYVILDALGYSSTALYLFPAIQKNAQYFPIVSQYDNTHTYLLRFLREQAEADLMPQE